MKDHFLYPLFCKMRPKQAALDKSRAVQAFLEFFTALYLAPFALVGLVWLLLASDYRQFAADPRGFVVLFISLLIVQSRPATVPLRLGARTTTFMTISLGSILVWMGMFIWGPAAILVDLLVTIIIQSQDAWRRSRYTPDTSWMFAAQLLQDIANTTLTNLIGISLYTALGGQIPLAGLTLVEWWPAFAALVASALFPAVAMLPVIVQINRATQGRSTWVSLVSFIFSIMRVLLITTPFAIPFTLLYTRATPAINAFAILGLVLVNLLLHYLSRTNQRSRQRTREMTALEALGEQILQAPPDGVTLRDLLAEHAGRMFQDPRDILEIRLFEGVDLPGFAGDTDTLHILHPPQAAPAPDSYWEDLRMTDEPHLVFENVVPEGAKAVYGDGVLDKITSAAPVEQGEAPATIGGVYLLRHKSVADSLEALPAVQALASQVASALQRARVHTETLAAARMAQELAFAGQIQASFLPEEVPTVEGWGIAASLKPARQTAGDFYDFIPLGEGKLGLVVADVADKGTGAALYMALSRTLIRTHAMQFPDRPAEALRLANERILADTRANQFVTVFYAVLDLNTGQLTYANAGHNPAFILRPADPEHHESYIRTGAPMGIFADLEWEEGTAAMGPDDLLLLYTDGVNEAQNIDEDFYEYDRLLSVTRSNLARSADQVHAAITESLQDFVGAAPQFDDITLMVLKRAEVGTDEYETKTKRSYGR